MMTKQYYPYYTQYQRIMLIGNRSSVSAQIGAFLQVDEQAIHFVHCLYDPFCAALPQVDIVVIDIDDLTAEEISQQVFLANRRFRHCTPVVLASNRAISSADLHSYLGCGVLDVICLSASSSRAVLASGVVQS